MNFKKLVIGAMSMAALNGCMDNKKDAISEDERKSVIGLLTNSKNLDVDMKELIDKSDNPEGLIAFYLQEELRFETEKNSENIESVLDDLEKEELEKKEYHEKFEEKELTLKKVSSKKMKTLIDFISRKGYEVTEADRYIKRVVVRNKKTGTSYIVEVSYDLGDKDKQENPLMIQISERLKDDKQESIVYLDGCDSESYYPFKKSIPNGKITTKICDEMNEFIYQNGDNYREIFKMMSKYFQENAESLQSDYKRVIEDILRNM